MTLLKLIALETADVPVLSAHLQDAVVRLDEMAYSPRDQRFAVLCNRFDWAGTATTQRTGERRRSGLRIDRVTSAHTQGIDHDAGTTVLLILAVLFEPSPDPAASPAGTLTLVCAGQAAIRLDVECVEMVLEDLGPAWEAARRPEHSDA